MPPVSVPGDYRSLGRYLWPDPANPDGPWIRRDGVSNSDRLISHPAPEQLSMVISRVIRLVGAYGLSRNEKFAAKAAELLRVFFIEPETRMNPHLNFAQAWPGRHSGSSYGIIESSRLSELVETIPALKNFTGWSERDQSSLHLWFSDYLNWLQTSELGIRARELKNNHGTHYDALVASLLDFLGDQNGVRRVLETIGVNRIATQILPSGEQPLETARTRPLHYSIFNLAAFDRLVELGTRVGVDLLFYRTPDGRSIRKAWEYVETIRSDEESVVRECVQRAHGS